MVEQEKPTSISKEQNQGAPSYIVKFPENKPGLTEIDCLGLKNPRTKNILAAFGITKISELSSLSDDYLLYEIPVLRGKALAEIHSKIESFRHMLMEKEAENLGEPVIIEIPPKILPKKSEREKKRMAIIDYVKTWQEEHPGRWGAQSAAGKMFGISKERVRQILAKYHDESLKPKGVISLYQLAHQLETKPRTIVNLLRQSKVSFGDKKIDEFYRVVLRCPSVFYQLRRIPVSSVDMNKLKDELTKPQSIKWIMEQHLTKGIAERHKDIFIPLSRLARQTNMANMGNLREIPRVYDELTTAGFHLKKIPLNKYAKSYYYFAHNQETSAIITYLQEKYQGRSKA